MTKKRIEQCRRNSRLVPDWPGQQASSAAQEREQLNVAYSQFRKAEREETQARGEEWSAWTGRCLPQPRNLPARGLNAPLTPPIENLALKGGLAQFERNAKNGGR